MQIRIPKTGIECGTYGHRVIRHSDGAESILMVHEVHFGADGTCRGWSQDGAAVIADSLEGLRNVVRRIARALQKPILVERHEGGTVVLVEELTGLPVRGTAFADLPPKVRAEMEAVAATVEDAVPDSDETLQ